MLHGFIASAVKYHVTTSIEIASLMEKFGIFFLRLKFQVAESCQVTLQSCGFFGGSPRRNRDLKGR